jgi:HD-GYP domain-containing protein (c-di-GMP phosphodiesterase class II)
VKRGEIAAQPLDPALVKRAKGWMQDLFVFLPSGERFNAGEAVANYEAIFIQTRGRAPPNATIDGNTVYIFANRLAEISADRLARILLHEAIESHLMSQGLAQPAAHAIANTLKTQYVQHAYLAFIVKFMALFAEIKATIKKIRQEELGEGLFVDADLDENRAFAELMAVFNKAAPLFSLFQKGGQDPYIYLLKALIQVLKRSLSPDTYAHTVRSRALVWRLLDRMVEMGADFPLAMRKLIAQGDWLHDWGKMIFVDSIIKNETIAFQDLDKARQTIIRMHPEWGARALEIFGVPDEVVRIVRHHHENFDGTGYPEGLKGEEIPICARVMRVVDTFDSMTGGRVFHSAQYGHKGRYSVLEALSYLVDNKGTLFDPFVVDALFSLYVFGMGLDMWRDYREAPYRWMKRLIAGM